MPAAGNDDMSDANRRTPVKGNKEPIGQCSCTALRKATRRVSQLYDAALEPCGLRTTQRAILARDLRGTTKFFYAVIGVAGAMLLASSALWRLKGVKAAWTS